MRKIILTFDYEVFLGKNTGDIHKSLIEPTERLIKLFQKYDAKGIFFVDYLFLQKLKEDYPNIYILIENQLTKLVQLNSNIELHIHPHWLDAMKSDYGKWSFKSFDKFRLHSLNESQIQHLFYEGKKNLEAIARKVKKQYTIKSFRAGGWSIMPFDKLAYSFERNEIKYDFSVLPGEFINNPPHHFYDFRKAPSLEYWRFNDDLFTPIETGRFIEIPVSTFQISFYDFLLNKVLIRKNKIFGDGLGLQLQQSLFVRVKKVLSSRKRKLTTDFTSPKIINKYLSISNRELECFVAHPKVFTEESFLVIEDILKKYKTFNIQDIEFYVNR